MRQRDKICLIFILLLTFSEISLQFVDYYFDDTSGLGRVYDGIGAISAGGSTKLLLGYPEQQRNEILDYLFKPNFGASLQILKVEIGSDTQSTDGTESTHMRTSEDENYLRGYEWWLMVEAKKVSIHFTNFNRYPKIKLYGLPWGFPGWVGGTTGNVYDDPDRMSMYIIKWINGARVHYNLTIDYVGIWNERRYNITYIKTLRKNLDANGFQDTKIIAADDARNSWDNLAKDILNDPKLAEAVYGIGVHHPATFSSLLALDTGKPLWASEDYSTYNNQTGGGCWARTLNQNYVNGFLTSSIAWALITSYYFDLPYYGHGLMTAIEPWSGHYEVASPIWITAHTTQFTEIGWKYLKHGSGVGRLSKGGSYVSLLSPDKKDFTIIIETMSHGSSVCFNPHSIPWYDVKPQNITIVLNGSMEGVNYLNAFYTQFNSSGKPILFKPLFPIMVENQRLDIYLGVDQVLTLTTLGTGRKGQHPLPPASEPFPQLYTEDFENYKEFQEPPLFAQQIGTFEVHDVGGAHGHVMRQMTLQKTIPFCEPLVELGIAMIGNTNWTNITVQSDVFMGDKDASDSVFIASRVDLGGCSTSRSHGVFLFFNPEEKSYILSGSLDRKDILLRGQATNVNVGWNTLSLHVQGSTALGEVNGKRIFSFTSLPAIPNQGFAAVGTGTFGYADFDNIMISNVQKGVETVVQDS